MLLLSRIAIRNFVVFERFDLEPSQDPDRPVTIIRAENQSGKTTFLRALRWGFYGEDGLPDNHQRDRDRWGMQPLTWKPEDGPIETSVSITFSTNGATRDHEGSGELRQLRLVRKVTTVPRERASEDDPNFGRTGETLSLMYKNHEGDWVDHARPPAEAVALLLPLKLRDFFFVDADEATNNYVGGGERKQGVKSTIETTTEAVKELLGLSVVDDARVRFSDHETLFRREASKASGDASISNIQQQLDELVVVLADKTTKLAQTNESILELAATLETQDREVEDELRKTGDPTDLKRRLADAKRRHGQAQDQRREALASMSGLLEAPELLGVLSLEASQSVCEALHSDHQRGLIPMSHLPFVRERLEVGECLCEESLAEGTELRTRVAASLEASEMQEDRANLLGETFRAADELVRNAKGPTFNWEERVEKTLGDLGQLSKEIGILEEEEDTLNGELKAVDSDRLQAARNARDATTKQLDRLKELKGELGNDVKTHTEKETGLKKELQARTRNLAVVQQATRAQELAASVGEALEQSYRRIQDQQVRDLSATMNRLFQQMVANLGDEDSSSEHSELRAFREVGVGPTQTDPSRYQIFVRGQQDRLLAATEINGASRRVLAMAFILGLAKESRTEAPLTADSLLNMMSGRVRRNTLTATSSNARQPILLLTRDDIGEHEAAIIDLLAGTTVTLTAQWDSDALGRTRAGELVTLICECSPRQFCSICEREGDQARPNWTNREASR